ncbi:hypothetical protein [Gimesia aquarii]|uniref:Uncharacterized protein n=1 Tax=Gimesia aquarii TaxID=2527964 RepID=A0A517X2Z9_9PLAN|nr:hypothetical protein [Gimesia aquarii]QDU11891.1 hypothetical protein V202x_53160 [Gimesia aquarii]
MWCLVFVLLRLYSGWWKVCGLSFGNCCKGGEVGKFDLCALMSRVWSIRDRLGLDFVAFKVNFGAKSSEDEEAVFGLPVEILLKRVGFMVLRSADAETFSIEKKAFAQEMRPLLGGSVMERVFHLVSAYCISERTNVAFRHRTGTRFSSQCLWKRLNVSTTLKAAAVN